MDCLGGATSATSTTKGAMSAAVPQPGAAAGVAAVVDDGAWPDVPAAQEEAIAIALHGGAKRAASAERAVVTAPSSSASLSHAVIVPAPTMVFSESTWTVTSADKLQRAGAGLEVALQTPDAPLPVTAAPPKRGRGGSVTFLLESFNPLRKATADGGGLSSRGGGSEHASGSASGEATGAVRHSQSAGSAVMGGSQGHGKAEHHGSPASSFKALGQALFGHHKSEAAALGGAHDNAASSPPGATVQTTTTQVLRTRALGGTVDGPARLSAAMELPVPPAGQAASYALYMRLRVWTGAYEDYHYHAGHSGGAARRRRRRAGGPAHKHHFTPTDPTAAGSSSTGDGSTPVVDATPGGGDGGSVYGDGSSVGISPLLDSDLGVHALHTRVRPGLGSAAVLASGKVKVDVWRVQAGERKGAAEGGEGDGSSSSSPRGGASTSPVLGPTGSSGSRSLTEHVLPLAVPSPLPSDDLTAALHLPGPAPSWMYVPLGIVRVVVNGDGAASGLEAGATLPLTIDLTYLSLEPMQSAAGLSATEGGAVTSTSDSSPGASAGATADPVAALEVEHMVAVPVGGVAAAEAQLGHLPAAEALTAGSHSYAASPPSPSGGPWSGDAARPRLASPADFVAAGLQVTFGGMPGSSGGSFKAGAGGSTGAPSRQGSATSFGAGIGSKAGTPGAAGAFLWTDAATAAQLEAGAPGPVHPHPAPAAGLAAVPGLAAVTGPAAAVIATHDGHQGEGHGSAREADGHLAQPKQRRLSALATTTLHTHSGSTGGSGSAE